MKTKKINESKKDKIIEIVAKTIQGILVFLMVAAFVFFVFVCVSSWFKPDEEKTIPTCPKQYDAPKVADTVKNDWVKDPGVCIERRIVYEQMINEKLAR
jgi:hypothetical protein